MTNTLPKVSSRCRLPKNMSAHEWLSAGEDAALDDARLAGLTMRKGQLVVLWTAKRVHRALPITALENDSVANRLQALLSAQDWAVLQGYVNDHKAGQFDDAIAEATRLHTASNSDVGF